MDHHENLQELQQSSLYTTPPGATSTVLLRGRISADKTPGEYRCSRVETCVS
jgi:hypothetical protein